MSVRDQICEAYDMLMDDSEDTEGVHIHLIQNEGQPNEKEVGILEFLDDETVYVEKYGEEMSDVRNASNMSKQEFKKFVLSVVSI